MVVDTPVSTVCVDTVCALCCQERQREEEARKTQEMMQKRRREIEEAEKVEIVETPLEPEQP